MHAHTSDGISRGCHDLQMSSPQLELLLPLEMLLLRVYNTEFNFWTDQCKALLKRKFKKKKECKRVIIACLLPVVICGLEKFSFECGRTKTLWSSSVSEMFSDSSLFCISEVLCTVLLTFLRAGCTEPWWWGLLASESFVDCENWPEIWWVLSVWLGNCSSLAQLTPVNDNLSITARVAPIIFETDLW